MASTYYNSSGKEVSDGDIAYADDLNSINSAVDAAFQLAEADIVAAGGDAAYWAGIAEGHADSAEADATQTAADRVQTGSDRASATASASSATSSASTASTAASTATTKAALAEQWAEEVEDTPVTTGKYSAKHWAAKAQASAGLQTLTGTGVDNTDPYNPVISITKSTISLGSVDNTSDANKPVSTATQTALNLKANLASPTLTGTPAAPTASVGTNTTQIATTAFVLANQTEAITLLHVQDQKAYNVDGGSSIADTWTKRTLNTEVYNNIAGSSLSGDQVTLTTGTYYVEGEAVFYSQSAGVNSVVLAIFKDDTRTLTGVTSTLYDRGSNLVRVSGVITVETSDVIDMRYYQGTAVSTSGLGLSNNSGSISDASILSVYADLKVWKLT